LISCRSGASSPHVATYMVRWRIASSIEPWGCGSQRTDCASCSRATRWLLTLIARICQQGLTCTWTTPAAWKGLRVTPRPPRDVHWSKTRVEFLRILHREECTWRRMRINTPCTRPSISSSISTHIPGRSPDPRPPAQRMSPRAESSLNVQTLTSRTCRPSAACPRQAEARCRRQRTAP